MAWRVEHLSSGLAEAIAQFQEEEMGTRPAEVSVTVGEDLVMVHLKDVLTPSERSLARTEAGQAVLQRFNTLRFNAAPSDKVQHEVAQTLNREVVEVLTNLSPLSGSLVVIYMLGQTHL
jgi:uncharacterized protein YbcI